MARNRINPLLGFEDEIITEKHKNQVNFTTNKIGGKPDLPSTLKLESPKCPLCQLPRPLVIQIYAPLENSPFHRTLYVFACINPNCWNQTDSWTCIRVQSQEQLIETTDKDATTVQVQSSTTDWCSEADDWGDDDDDDDDNGNVNEENGNVIAVPERVSDEDDESCSFDESVVRLGLGNLTVDERNANNGALGGAVGRLHSPSASAEIECDEGEVISIDTPTLPQNDILALLQQVTPLPQEFCNHHNNQQIQLQFVPYFITVLEETANNSSGISDRHVKELLQEYQSKNEGELSPRAEAAPTSDNAFEKYEKSNPIHGDKMFHQFLSKIQMNPGQILRYTREIEPPITLYPIQEVPKCCNYCKGEVIVEFQLLPTLIPKLKLITDKNNGPRLEFGTVLVFTCRGNCWGSDTNFRYESVVLQSEIY